MAVAHAQQPACEPMGKVATLIQTVRDQATRAPLASALVTATWPGAVQTVQVLTDSAGKARICAPENRLITLRVSYHDVRPPPQTTILRNGRTTEHTFSIDVPGVFMRGTVVDQATGDAVSNVSVQVVSTPLTSLTDEAGQFHFPRVPIGDHVLRVDHIAYGAIVSNLNVRKEDLMVTVRLTPAAIALEPIIVTAFSRRLDHVGFYQRERRGVGTFISRKQIDAMNAHSGSDLLRRVPGMRLVPEMSRSNHPSNSTLGRGNCRYTYMVDGARTLADFEMDFVAPYMVEGVEVYNGSGEVPAAFRAHTSGGRAKSCGVVVVWTRDGR